MRLFILALLAVSQAFGAYTVNSRNVSSGATSGIWTIAGTVATGNITLVGNVAGVCVHFNSGTFASITGGGANAVWTFPPNASAYNGANNRSGCAYGTRLSPGAQSIVVTITVSGAYRGICLWDISKGGSGITQDAGPSGGAGNVYNAVAANPQAGAALTLSGGNDVVFGAVRSGNGATLSSVNTGTFTSSGSGQTGFWDSANTGSSAVPSFTFGSAATILAASIALTEIYSGPVAVF